MIKWSTSEEVQFVVGDVARLRSGGPEMTIYDISGDMVSVIWFPYPYASEPSRDKVMIDALSVKREILTDD